MPGCPPGFFCESGDLAIRHRPLIANGSEISEQLIALLNKLSHPGDLSFAYRLDGDALFSRLQKTSKRFDRDSTDDTACIPLSSHLLK